MRDDPTSAADHARGALAAFGCLLLAGLLGHHRLLSLSTDVALHLQEVKLAERFWTFPVWAKESLSELWWYPKLSHRLAASLVRLGSGEIDAMTTAGCVSAAVVWLILLSWARRVSAFVLAAAAALVLADVFTLRAVLGAELIDNFFYPQLVAEAVALAGLAVGAWLLRRTAWGGAAWLTAATVACGCVHLLPTLKLAGAGMALLALDAVRAWLQARRVAWASLAGVLALPAAVVLNPFFAAMRWIAGNDGSVNFAVPIGPLGVSAAALVLLALCGAVLLPRLRMQAQEDDAAGRAVELLAALGAAAAAAALAQEAAWVLHHDGSAYAVKKHGFGVFTMLAFLVPLATARWAPRLMRAPAAAWSAPVAAILILSALFARPSRLNVWQAQQVIEGAERQARAARLAPAGALFGSDTAPPLVTYAVNVAVLWTQHGTEAFTMFDAGQPAHPEVVAELLTREGDLYDVPACRRGGPILGVVRVRGGCAAAPATRFASDAPGTAYLREGWAKPETGVWSQARHASAEIPLPADAKAWRGAWLVVSTFAFTPPESPRRTVILSAAGQRLPFRFDRATAMTHDFVVRLEPATLKGGRLRLAFDVPDAVAPAALGLGDDPRLLGVGLDRIRILPDRHAPPG